MAKKESDETERDYVQELLNRPNCMITWSNKPLTQEGAKKTIEILDDGLRQDGFLFDFMQIKNGDDLSELELGYAQDLIKNDYNKEEVLDIVEEKFKQMNLRPWGEIKLSELMIDFAQFLVLARYPVIQEFIDNRGFFDLEGDVLVADRFIGQKLIEAIDYIGSLGIEDLGSSKDLLKYVLFAGLKEEERAEFTTNLEGYLNQQDIVTKKRLADKVEHYAKNDLIALSYRGFFNLYLQFHNKSIESYPKVLLERIPTLAKVMMHIMEGELKCVYDTSRERFELVRLGTYRGGEVPSQFVDPFLQECPEQEKKGKLDVLVDELLFLGQYIIEKRNGNQKYITSQIQ